MNAEYTFEEFVVDADRRELRRHGDVVHTQPQVFDVLCMLLEHHERVVTKEELLDEVWGDRFVTESALASRIKSIRRLLGDDGRRQRLIRTVHGSGYMWVGPEPQCPVRSSPSSPEGAAHVDVERAVDDRRPTRALPFRRERPVGRQEEVDRLGDLLRRCQVVTIVGPGGAGKTTLALEAVHDREVEFPDGVVWCELASAGADDVLAAVFDALSASAGSGDVTIDRLVDALDRDRTLLVLDNCEHVIDAIAHLVDELVTRLPGLTVLATSREALDVHREHVLQLGGLDAAAAVDLFRRRAAEIVDLPPEELTGETAHQIVATLEGLPLAIELAVPRLVASSPRELLASLDDQMSVLGSRRRHHDRQRTMSETISWSFRLLTTSEQSVLLGLSVFAGTFTTDAAAAVLDREVRSDLQHLVEKSMVSVVRMELCTRYRLLEPIRQFVSELLGEDQQRLLRRRHADYFAAETLWLAAQLRTAREGPATQQLTAEWADIGHALAWGRAHDRADIAVDPLLALGLHLQWQMRSEGFTWLERAVTELPSLGSRRPAVDILRARGASLGGDTDRAETLLARGVDAAGPDVESLIGEAHVSMATGDIDRLARVTPQIHHHAASSNDPSWRILGLTWRLIGRAIRDPDDPELDVLIAEVRDAIAGEDWPTGRCWGHLALVITSVRCDRLEDARAHLDALAADAAPCRADWLLAMGTTLVAQGTVAHDDADDQLSRVVRSVRSTVVSGGRAKYPWMFRSLIVALVAAHRIDDAVRTIGLVRELEDINPIERLLSAGYERAEREALAAVEPTRRCELLDEGARSSPAELIRHLDRPTAVMD